VVSIALRLKQGYPQQQGLAQQRTGVKSCGWLNRIAQLPSMYLWKLQQRSKIDAGDSMQP
jgi:hypothetical protein